MRRVCRRAAGLTFAGSVIAGPCQRERPRRGASGLLCGRSLAGVGGIAHSAIAGVLFTLHGVPGIGRGERVQPGQASPRELAGHRGVRDGCTSRVVGKHHPCAVKASVAGVTASSGGWGCSRQEIGHGLAGRVAVLVTRGRRDPQRRAWLFLVFVVGTRDPGAPEVCPEGQSQMCGDPSAAASPSRPARRASRAPLSQCGPRSLTIWTSVFDLRPTWGTARRREPTRSPPVSMSVAGRSAPVAQRRCFNRPSA